MTLSQRNRFFIIGIVVSTFSFIVLLISARTIFPIFADAAAAASVRTISFLQPLINLIFTPQPYAVLVSIFLSCIYAIIASIVIYFYFEKTQCQEILFFTFFVSSFCFESLRFFVPIDDGIGLPRIYLIMTGRMIIFGRIFGILSLFTSSIFAAGFQIQKQSHVILMTIIISMIIAAGVPIDALSWDSALNIVSGYSTMLFLAETGIFFFAIMSFFTAIYSRGAKEYIHIGLGALLLFFGRNILLNCDTWILLPIAAALLGFGTWYICSRLHQIYLWL
jgi:hypothetical protein